MGAVVDLLHVTVAVDGGRRVLGPVDLRVGQDERWVVLGPNGSGKTTLLSVAGASLHPTSGVAIVLGRTIGRTDVRSLRQEIGYVGLSLAERLRPAMRVRDVVLTGIASGTETWGQTFGPRERAAAEAALDRVGCAQLADRGFATCSQGERQRVLLARAMIGPRSLLLLDEPAAGLDLPGREHLLRAIEVAEGPAWILTTHHLEEIPPNATHALLLDRGSVVAAGPIAATVRSDTLSRCMGLEVAVGRDGDRWRAVADPAVTDAAPAAS